MSENRGAFYIPAEDITTTNKFFVPKDKAGETPQGNDNPTQSSYSLDDGRRDIAKQYYVHVHNDLDVDVEIGLKGSSFDDEEMNKAVQEQTLQTVSSGQVEVLESDTGHSYLEVEVDNFTAVPSSGTLEIVMQNRFR